MKRPLHVAVPLSVAAMLVMGQGCPSTTSPPASTTDGDPNTTGTTTNQDRGLPAQNARVAFQSQCAQNVITCTVEFPRARFTVIAGAGQQVTATAKGFLVQGSDRGGSEVVNLVSNSTAGQNATALFHSWSQGATDSNPLTLTPGPEFSKLANPYVELRTGLHYVRLHVYNDIFRDELQTSTGDVLATNVFLYDMVELEIDVRD